jgi:hypothetical protein
MMHRGRFLLPVVALLGGCTLGPDYERPELAVPESYVQPVQEGESFANMPWWDLFQDEQLQELMRIALEENQDLGVAAARVEEFRATLGVTRADQFPTIDVNATGAQAQNSDNVFPGNLFDDTVENYRVSADVFFELDLFGRLRRSTEAARAQLLSEEENRRSITISLISSVASTYMLLRDLDAQLIIARDTEEAREDSLRIIQARFEKGTVPRLDVNQAEIELYVASAAVSAAERSVAQAENSLAILLGRGPNGTHWRRRGGTLAITVADRVPGPRKRRPVEPDRRWLGILERRHQHLRTDLQRRPQPQPGRDRTGANGTGAANLRADRAARVPRSGRCTGRGPHLPRGARGARAAGHRGAQCRRVVTRALRRRRNQLSRSARYRAIAVQRRTRRVGNTATVFQLRDRTLQGARRRLEPGALGALTLLQCEARICSRSG